MGKMFGGGTIEMGESVSGGKSVMRESLHSSKGN